MQGTPASEELGTPGDNALFTVARELTKLGFNVTGTGVALLPTGAPIGLVRRGELITKGSEADLVVVFGADTLRKIKGWFPLGNAISVPLPYYFILEPGKIRLELISKIKMEIEIGFGHKITGYNSQTNEIG